VLPGALVATRCLSPGAKLCWAAIAKRLGKVGSAYPSLRTLGLDLGVDRRQIFRWVAELEHEKFLRSIERPARPGDNDSNEYRLLWHEVFAENDGVDKSSYKKSHHQKRKIEKVKDQGSRKPQRKSVQSEQNKTGRTKLSNSFPDDDDGKPKRELLEEPQDELRLRFKERFGDGSGAILQTIVADLGFDRQALAEFVAFDDAHTGAPGRLKNPGGYYRALVKQFRAARIARIESEQRERYRAMERTLSPQEPEEKAICELGLCDGGGELSENGEYRPCDCPAGQNLSPKVRELMEQMRQGVA